MQRALRLTLLWTAVVLVAIGVALAIAYAKLVPGDAELAERIRSQAEARLGVGVKVGSARLRLWPSPELVIDDAATVQPEPIRIRRLVAQAGLASLLRGEVNLDDVQVEGGVLPQLSLRGLRLQAAPQNGDAKAVQVSQLKFKDMVWITRHGIPLEFSGSAQFGPGWQLRHAELLRPDVRPVTRLALSPVEQGRWKVDLQLGGGTADGEVKLRTGPKGELLLTGQLTPKNIDLSSAMSSFKRHSAVLGRASGQTELSASGANVGDLARTLHTRTAFSVGSARLLHIDVDKTIRTFGQERGGETPLQTLTGQMDTQNTPQGMAVRYTGLQARGQSFSARGGATIANRRIDDELTVDLAGGLVGVPLKVSGPVSKPQVTVPPQAVAGAAAGAAIGTAVLPGIGTAIGAGVGAAVGKLFGGDTRRPAPAR